MGGTGHAGGDGISMHRGDGRGRMIDAHLTTDSEYRLADWVRRKVVLLTGLGRVKDAEDTVRHYLYLPEIRKDEVERCIASGEYHPQVVYELSYD